MGGLSDLWDLDRHVNIGPNEKERLLVWELTPHNDSIEFEIRLQVIGGSADRVVRPSVTCTAADGKVHGSLRCTSGGRYVYLTFCCAC